MIAELLANHAGVGLTPLILLLAAVYGWKALSVGALFANWMRTAIVVLALTGVASAIGVIHVDVATLQGLVGRIVSWGLDLLGWVIDLV